MSFLDLFNTSAPTERIQYAMEKAGLEDEVGYLNSQVRELQEDMLAISDAFDNVGWSPLPGEEASEMTLKTVKKVAKLARAMNAMNPFIKRGVNARISYIWGKGVSFDGVDSIQQQIDDNRKRVFSPQAYEEYERVLATDGNAFLAVPREQDGTETVFRVTLDEIEGCVANPLDKEDIWYYRREYTVKTTNGASGEVTEKKVSKYYASMDYYKRLEREGRALPKRWNKFGVEQNYVMQHVAVNKQVGWKWGVPDIMPVIFWAKAYKEYLEDNAMLVKAYSRLAWQIKASSANGANAAAAQVLRPPTRDPLTGDMREVGGTAIGGNGTDLSPIAAVGSSVDFSKGSPLASAIASGLEVSLVVITSDPGSGNRATAETLDLPTLKAMESRQNIHTERLLEVFEFWGADIRPAKQINKSREIAEAEKDTPDNAIVTWPQIETDTTKDRVTAIGSAVELGLLFLEEGRKEVIDVLGIAPFKPWNVLPTPEDNPQKVYEQEQAELGFQREQESAKVIAAQGQSGGTSAKGGAQTSSNSARNNRSSDKNNS